MFRSIRRAVGALAIVRVACAGVACGTPPTAPATTAADSPGNVRFVQAADSAFDKHTKAPDAGAEKWMRGHYWRMRAWSPYFDARTAWYPNAWFYRDAYAIYVGTDVAAQHPEWILRDPHANKLYIPHDCAGSGCTQYAADIGNPDFRAWWIAHARATMAGGHYRGIFVDDVNMEMTVSDGAGNFVAPIDRGTGAPMTDASWQRYMAEFMVQIRAALPKAEIVHNALWFAGDSTQDLRRELNAADYIEIERGFNDPGIVGGSSRFGFDTLLRFIDDRHAAGKGVILDGYADTPAASTYGLASYFLVSAGHDALGNDAYGTPDRWWTAYDVKLGAPKGPRYRAGTGVWRRDFAHGSVLVNEPGAPTRTTPLTRAMRHLDGGGVHDSVTLGPASGVVLLS
jgi:hypothetical protein